MYLTNRKEDVLIFSCHQFSHWDGVKLCMLEKHHHSNIKKSACSNYRHHMLSAAECHNNGFQRLREAIKLHMNMMKFSEVKLTEFIKTLLTLRTLILNCDPQGEVILPIVNRYIYKKSFSPGAVKVIHETRISRWGYSVVFHAVLQCVISWLRWFHDICMCTCCYNMSYGDWGNLHMWMLKYFIFQCWPCQSNTIISYDSTCLVYSVQYDLSNNMEL